MHFFVDKYNLFYYILAINVKYINIVLGKPIRYGYLDRKKN